MTGMRKVRPLSQSTIRRFALHPSFLVLCYMRNEHTRPFPTSEGKCQILDSDSELLYQMD